MAESKRVVTATGTVVWYLITDGIDQNVLHREDGPAIEYIDGDKDYYQYGVRHRLDGPAFTHADGYGFWSYQGQRLDCETQEEFEALLKLKAFW